MIPSRVTAIDRLCQLEEYMGAENLLHNCFFQFLSIDELNQIIDWTCNDYDLQFDSAGVLKEITEWE